MPARWEKSLKRWQDAGLLDAAAAERIHAFETSHAERQKMQWPVILAVSLGGLMLAAGVLLFVAAHWARFSPSVRLATVLLLVAVFHCAGALAAERFEKLSIVFHAVGTACLGAGIFLAAQIFNLEEDWSGGMMLWTLGAALGWFVLKQTPQALLAAVLAPIWLAGKWSVETNLRGDATRLMSEGLCLLAISYLSARTAEHEDATRRGLVWIGGLALIPLSIWVAVWSDSYWRGQIPVHMEITGWVFALGLPLLLAVWLRGRESWPNFVAAAWVVLLGTMSPRYADQNPSLFVFAWHKVGSYVWCAAGSSALIAWGLQEKRKERINLGVAGFALTIAFFYFSSVMDKLGRSASLMGFGVLFLFGGWLLEKTRRRLVARLGGSTA